jgi:hypothetical protein
VPLTGWLMFSLHWTTVVYDQMLTFFFVALLHVLITDFGVISLRKIHSAATNTNTHYDCTIVITVNNTNNNYHHHHFDDEITHQGTTSPRIFAQTKKILTFTSTLTEH